MSTTPGKRGRSLAAALSKVATEQPAALEPAAPASVEAEPQAKLVGVLLYVKKEDHDRLRDLSHHSRKSLQQLGIEAWNLLLDQLGHPPLAPTTQNRPSGRRRG